MHSFEDVLKNLAAGVRSGDPTAPRRFQEALEANLVPLIRCAIRTGRGVPRLVQWVQRNLPRQPAGAGDPTAAPEGAAPRRSELSARCRGSRRRPRRYPEGMAAVIWAGNPAASTIGRSHRRN